MTPNQIDDLNARISVLKARAKLDSWNAFVEELKVPQDLMPAFLTMRPELVRLTQPRDMTAVETKALLELLAGLIETNMALREHAEQVHLMVRDLASAFIGLHTLGLKVQRFASFDHVPDEPVEDDTDYEPATMVRSMKDIKLHADDPTTTVEVAKPTPPNNGVLVYAYDELTRAGFSEQDRSTVLQLMETFFDSWDSGGAVSVMIPVLNSLLRMHPLSPLTGEPDEWVEVGEGVFQNKRCGSVFKDTSYEGGMPYDIDAVENPNQRTWITFPYLVQDHR